LLLTASSVGAQAWWNPDWAYRKKISLNAAEAVALTGADTVLVPVRLHGANFTFLDAQDGGGDLRFVAADDKTPLNHHVERFDGIENIAIVWVQVPVAARETFFWLYFGNPAAADAGNPKACFDAHMVAAFHFGERDGVPRDTSAYATQAMQANGKSGSAGAVGFGYGVESLQGLRIAASPALATPPGTGWTVSMWLRAADAAANGVLLSREEGRRRLVFALEGGRPVLTLTEGRESKRVAAPVPIDGGTWHHLAFALGDRALLYVDGHVAAEGAWTLPDLRSDIVVGGGSPAGGPAGIRGEIDELQIANVMRPPSAIRSAALIQHPQSNLVLYAEDESGGGNDYLAVLRTLAGAVSTDGWVIIALIGAMGLMTVEVMLSKARRLRHAVRQNAEFLQNYRQPGSPVARMQSEAVVAGAEAWPDSPLFHLYEVAHRELQAVRAAEGRALSANALEVVRAGIDAGLVGQSHKLNDRLVLLTVAVSGAPFLGLLGTVVGIMITFGAIALAGDVNVNTIAPGVAAALTTTVAGLIIAIPAMFAYNHLTTKVKVLTAGMETFANELLSRLAWEGSAMAEQPPPRSVVTPVAAHAA
jgi:biopolymer transport protein ExbB